MLVIGIGSSMMKDDGIGTRVVEAIQCSLREHNIVPLAAETDFQCCFDEINPDDFVIIIDAVAQGKKPGSIDVMPMSDVLKSREKLRTQHEYTLFDLIRLHYPGIQGCFIGIEAAEIGFGLELTEPLRLGFEQICSTVLSIVFKRFEI